VCHWPCADKADGDDGEADAEVTKTPAAADASAEEKAGPSSPAADGAEAMDAEAQAPAEVLLVCLRCKYPDAAMMLLVVWQSAKRPSLCM
jgi:hypothetical protein